jgi:type II secretory pathway pseudopilin PulG
MGSSPYPAEPPKKKGGATWIIVGVLGCLGLLVLVAIVGIVAAIAIPSLLKARISANEAQNIGDIRSMISAQVVYQTESGRYGSLECLQAPASCLKSYSGPSLLSPEMAQTEKGGYRRTFELTPDGEGFTYVAVPITPTSTGVRAFCGDGTGVICVSASGARPNTSGGRCQLDATCMPLR